MSIEIVRSLPEDEWRRFVENHLHGNIFHTPEMFQVFAHTRGHRPELWGATHDGRILALMLPVKISLSGGLMRHFTTRAVVYGSVLCISGVLGRKALAELLEAYKRDVVGPPLFTELRNIAGLREIQPVLNEGGFTYEDHLNYLIDLNCPTQTIFQRIGARTRKNIRHGLNRKEIIIEEAKEPRQIATCYELIRRTYRDARVPLADKSLFEAAFAVLSQKRMVRFTVAYFGQIPAAASVELLYKDVIYGWYGGMDRSLRSYNPNELLVWHILEWGSKNNYRTYDFGGAGKPTKTYGVRNFKAKFGGTLACFGRNIYVHAPFRLLIGKLGYKVFRYI